MTVIHGSMNPTEVEQLITLLSTRGVIATADRESTNDGGSYWSVAVDDNHYDEARRVRNWFLGRTDAHSHL